MWPKDYRQSSYRSVIDASILGAIRKDVPRSSGRIGQYSGTVLLIGCLPIAGVLGILETFWEQDSEFASFIVMGLFGAFVGVCAYYAGKHHGYDEAWIRAYKSVDQSIEECAQELVNENRRIDEREREAMREMSEDEKEEERRWLEELDRDEGRGEE